MPYVTSDATQIYWEEATPPVQHVAGPREHRPVIEMGLDVLGQLFH